MNSAVPSQVRALAESPALISYCSLLEHFLNTGESADQLPARAAALAAEARALDVPPEHILYALRVARCNVGHRAEDTVREREVGRRYTAGIALLLRHYFGVHEDDIEPVGDVSRARSVIERDFRAEVAIRMVADARSGALWRVELRREGYTSTPGLEGRRRDWLACESGEERRYISPVRADWLTCPESELLEAIRGATDDERRKELGKH